MFLHLLGSTVIKRTFLSILLSFSIITILSFGKPAQALSDISSLKPIFSNFSPLATLNYEAKEKTSLLDPVTDPNFNVMRNQEMGKSFAIPLVVGVLLLAIAAPIVTWWYFSR